MTNSNIEQYKQEELKNEIDNAHETALRSEKSAIRLSRQAVKMVKRGESSAPVKQSLREKLAASMRHENDDAQSTELATNAALKDDNIEVTVTAGYYDGDFRAPDELKIKSIDGEDV